MDFNEIKKELQFRFSRSSGSGGQHVNKVATKVELLFNIEESNGLEEEEKERIKKRLANRINNEGILVISSQENRSQHLNKSAAIKKCSLLLQKALLPQKKRKAVKPLTAKPSKRLASKRKKAEKKSFRAKVRLSD